MILSDKFIKATDEFSTTENNIPAPYFRHSFEIADIPKCAELTITGLGFYEVYLNGENITKGYLAPYRSHLDDYVYYDNYDIREKLKCGKNTLGIVLGNGMINPVGAYVWKFEQTKYRGAPVTAFCIELEYDNGNKTVIEADENTLTHPSPIIFDDLHYGEYYDARLEIPNWNKPDFDDSQWKNATVTKPLFTGEKKLCCAEPICERGRIEPIAITKYENAYIYDFGVNSAGVCELNIEGAVGQEIELHYFEVIIDNKPYFKNLTCNSEDLRNQIDKYTLSGKGKEKHLPIFTYHGFRYVLVSGITEKQATQDLLTFVEIYSKIEKTANFVCSDEIINKLVQATERSNYTNFHYFPTDCPQREKNGWTGDISISAEQLNINFNAEKSFEEWMYNVYKSMNEKGSIPGIVPSTGNWGYSYGPSWDAAMINIPFYTYLYHGNKAIIKDLAEPLFRHLHYLNTLLNSDNLIEIGLGDWCPQGTEPHKHKTPKVVTSTASAYDIASKAVKIYELLGKNSEKEYALALAEKIRTAFREKLIDKQNCTVESENQTAQALGLYYGFFEGDEIKPALNQLLKYIDEQDGHFDTGVIGSRVLYRVLADYGEADLAFNMIVRPDFPSYGNWMARGATTLWEQFQNSEYCASRNHHFWGDVSAWFYIYLAGIRVNPTFKDSANVDIKPSFVEKLSFVKAQLDIYCGKISVDWERKNNKILLSIDIPEKLQGKVLLPSGYAFTDGTDCKKLETGSFEICKI